MASKARTISVGYANSWSGSGEVDDPDEFLEGCATTSASETFVFHPRGRRDGAACRRDAGGLRLRGPPRSATDVSAPG